jgi:putative tryptophan/tyrosine transport system substrate-binding protein
MTTRILGVVLAAMLAGLAVPVQAQKQANIPRLGILRPGAPVIDRPFPAFLQALRELGYVDGKNIVLEFRYAEGKRDRLPELATELVQLKVDVLFTGSNPAIFALKQATQIIPIGIVSSSDPIGTGFVASLARPGGNITGMSLMASDLWPKRLELLKEIVPKLSRAAMFWNKSNAGMTLEAKATQEVAGLMGVTLIDRGVKDPNEIDSVLEATIKDRPDGFLPLMDLSLRSHEKRILEFLVKYRLPAIFENKEMVEVGGLMSYGANYDDVYRRAAVYIDKILKGTKPADLPVEQPTKFDFVINLKTAQQIGLTIPPNVLARADKVIK